MLAPPEAPAAPRRPGRRRLLVPAVAAVVVLAPLAWLWQASLLPGTYSVTDMGTVDDGRGNAGHAGHAATAGGRSVDSLTEPSAGPADVRVELVAREEPFRLASGEETTGYTLNGTSPGPVVHAELGQLVEVRLVNESVRDGVTLHWHGLDVPNADDGVAGVTQDAVPVGGSFTYRFRVHQAGTFWYHSHQASHVQVQRGLLGALVVTPPGGVGAIDALALVHLYDGTRTVNGRSGETPVAAAPGERVRVRVVNTDNAPMSVWVPGRPFRVLAVDGSEVHGPGEVRDVAVEVTGGARTDLEVVAPARIDLGGASVLVGEQAPPAAPRPAATLDLLTYGTPAPLGFDPAAATRSFDYVIGRSPGFLDGVPGMWWTINGHLFPDVPMYMVAEGDVVRMRVENRSGEGHPMHLHGHHAVVLSRGGVPAAGSPWWVDSLQVADGETYEIAFVADNPGVWTDHCHNLPHAVEGLVAHLMYEGVTTPHRIGGPNTPE
ncbi:multicopper oxidase family protein [Pseudonocardia adelaidensis]|uniref:FtsP/CotA-like multicopper oxidase with cupredoxin domain n=1 Tax=Pseudonocardia adelaidensis TaxID=648754 RepID=A0ABP9NTZ6_9PSEU